MYIVTINISTEFDEFKGHKSPCLLDDFFYILSFLCFYYCIDLLFECRAVSMYGISVLQQFHIYQLFSHCSIFFFLQPRSVASYRLCTIFQHLTLNISFPFYFRHLFCLYYFRIRFIIFFFYYNLGKFYYFLINGFVYVLFQQ